MEAGTAPMHAPGGERLRTLGVPLAGFAVIAGTVAFGIVAEASGHSLGSAQPPLLYDPDWHASVLALLAVAVLAAGVALAPRLRSRTLSPPAFAAAALALGLVLRLAVGAARDGAGGWYAVYDVPNKESSNEYLPVLPAFDLGARFFLDTFAEIGTSLPVHAIGHPPGLLLTLHALGIDTAEGMAALTIGIGALSIPLVYVLGRRLLDEARARVATLLYAFAPSAVLHGVTSADALFATLAVLAVAALLARRRDRRGAASPFDGILAALGPPAFALASFFSYANLAVGALAVIVTLRRDGVRRALALGVACAVALLAFYGLLHLFTGFDPIGALRSTEIVYREGVASNRPYAFWIFGSPVAFLLAAGVPLAWLALRALGAGETVAVALFSVVMVSAVLGFTKAETERIYLFLVPFLCLAAATTLPRRYLTPVLGLLAVQAIATELLFETVW
ncbi:MAG: hypothetical protein H0X56_05645 [Solirubrobacterales bacterium]|nr:hypothetical protein [Solirubrobacterales bacterium]